MNDFSTIDSSDLARVTGGADDGRSCVRAKGKIEGSTPGVSVSGEGEYESCTTNYAECVRSMPGATPEQKRNSCGLPGGGQ